MHCQPAGGRCARPGAFHGLAAPMPAATAVPAGALPVHCRCAAGALADVAVQMSLSERKFSSAFPFFPGYGS